MKTIYSLILLTFATFTLQAQTTTVPCNVSLTATTSGNGGCVADSITYTNPNLALNNTFTFPGVAPNVISGSVTITAMGDIDLTSEYWTVLSEAGATLTQVGGSGGQCATVYVVTIPLTAAELIAWSANGTIDFQVNGTTAVNTSLCGNDFVQVTFEACYPVANCMGTDVNLVAQGTGQQTVVMSNDFNNGTLGTGWSATGGTAVGSPCGPSLDGTDYYWASTSTGTPQLTTVAYDVSCGGTISFDMAYATQGGGAPCEGPDLANEGVTLQYSTDGGATWTVIQYWDPNGGYDPQMTSWNNYTIPIPAGAMGPNTQFQWIQNNSSGTCCDNWGIDNVLISTNTNCSSYWYDYDHITGSPDPNTDLVNVTTTTTFGVWYTNGVDSCYATTTVVVPPAATADAGPDVTICGGGNAVIGADPITPDEGSVYTWSTGASGTIDLTTPGTDNGQVTVNPTVTTEYYLEVDFNNCTAYDTVTVFMDNPPTASNPLPINVECIGDVPAPDPLVVTDEMDDLTPAPLVTHEGDVSDGLSCPETITRTYRVEDDCGNFILVDQIITVNDVTPPTASNPTTINLAGGTPVPAPDPLVVTDEADNCGVPTVAWVSDVSDGLNCPETITRTYSVTDDCGNSINVTQLITIGDAVPPTASNPPAINVECIGDVPVPDPLVVTDEADNGGVPTVTFDSAVSDGQSCPETITHFYIVTDNCGNSITVSQDIIVNDVTPPTASNIPGVFVPGGSPIPPVDVTLVNDEADNCTPNPVVAWVSDVSDNGVCPEIITRTYSVTDDCGNQTLVTQQISIGDPILPTASNPLPIQVECIGDVPAPDPLVVTDEADNGVAPPVVTFENDVSDGLSCPETITRTYRVTDDCGNFILVTQTITVQDTQAPTAGVPAAINVECIGDVPPADINVVTGVADNCTANPVVAHVGDVSDGLSCPETITRTYSITDDCGNVTTVDQQIIVNDVTPPTASNPTAIAVPGANDVPAPNPLDVTTEADNCTANPVVAWVSDVSDGNVCNGEIITRTYSVTDDCGNQTLVTQEITILATPPPIDAGPDQTICSGDLVMLTPSNPWNAALSWSPVPGQGSFPLTQTTTYTVIADNLGCISEDSVTITVEEAPIVSFVGDVLAGCAPHTVNFTNTSSSISGMADCEWTINGQTISSCSGGSFTFENSGTYDVTLTTTSNTGCTSTMTYTDYVYVEAVPVAAFTPSSNELESFYTQVHFTNNSTGASSYSWDFGDNSGLSTEENPSHSYPEAQSGNYTVTLTATSPLGCVDVTTASIVVNEQLIYYVPNTFTPDNDDFNETFRAVFTEGYDPFDFHMTLFNRWGEVIWESYDASVGWDGTYGLDGRPVQDGTYIWKIEFKTTRTDERIMITGHVNLIR